jgi:hypothetical protein
MSSHSNTFCLDSNLDFLSDQYWLYLLLGNDISCKITIRFEIK